MPTFTSELNRWPLRQCRITLSLLLLLTSPAACLVALGAATRTHTVSLGAPRRVPYTPSDAMPDEKAADTATMKVRPLIVDGRQREWTVGEIHDITDRTFAVRRMLRLNDRLPTDPAERWVWQPGPWLLVDRISGRVTALHLPEFDPLVSEVTWYRDYAAYCGVRTTVKGGLDAVVAQLGARKAIVEKTIARWPQPEHPSHVCQPAVWQRDPARVTIQANSGEPTTFDVVGSAVLVEPADDGEPDAP